MTRYTEDVKEEVVRLRARHFHPDVDEEWPYRAIEQETDVSQERIANWLNKAQLTGTDDEAKVERSIEILDDSSDASSPEPEETTDTEPEEGGDEVREDSAGAEDQADADDVDELDEDEGDEHAMPLDEDGVDGFVPDTDTPPPSTDQPPEPSEAHPPKQPPKQAPDQGPTQAPNGDPHGSPDGPTGPPPAEVETVASEERDDEEVEIVYEAECYHCGGTFGVEPDEIGEIVECPWDCGAQMFASRAGER
jgi:transposase-like protein